MSAGNGSDHDGLRNLSGDSEEVARYYDDWADDYDRTLGEWQYEAPTQVAARMRARLAPDAIVLDAGCGTGLSGRALADAGFVTIDGIDISQRSLDIAAVLGVYRSLQLADLQKLPLASDDHHYDGLVCVGVLTYVPDSAAILREFCRVTKPGGFMVLTQRSDILEARDFRSTLKTLERQGLLTGTSISEPMRYLPRNKEFADEVQVHYIEAEVLHH